MNNSLLNRINSFINDYEIESKEYYRITSDTMNDDPYKSYDYPLQHCKYKVSVIIPTWNSVDTLYYTLQSIGYSRLCSLFNNMLEVIVVDDGSTDNTYDSINNSKYPFKLIYIKQKHISRSAAINTGVKKASGELLVFCDSDILLFPNSLDEIIKRQQLFIDDCVFFGFREDYFKEDIEFSNLSEFLMHTPPAFWRDNRFEYDYPHGWGNNMMKSTSMLKNRLGSQNFYVSNGITGIDNCWQLYRMVYGFLFSVSRNNYYAVGGFDEKLVGWGWEDSLFVGKCLSLNKKIVPVPSAHCIHIYHEDRSKTKWEEAKRNFVFLKEILNQNVFEDNIGSDLTSRVIFSKVYTPSFRTNPIDYHPQVSNPIQYYFKLGNFTFQNKYISFLNAENEDLFLEASLYTKNFSIIKIDSINISSYWGNMVKILNGNTDLTPINNIDSDYMVFCNQLTVEDFMKRLTSFETEKQFLLAAMDAYAILNKMYNTTGVWAESWIQKIRYLYSLYLPQRC